MTNIDINAKTWVNADLTFEDYLTTNMLYLAEQCVPLIFTNIKNPFSIASKIKLLWAVHWKTHLLQSSALSLLFHGKSKHIVYPASLNSWISSNNIDKNEIVVFDSNPYLIQQGDTLSDNHNRTFVIFTLLSLTPLCIYCDDTVYLPSSNDKNNKEIINILNKVLYNIASIHYIYTRYSSIITIPTAYLHAVNLLSKENPFLPIIAFMNNTVERLEINSNKKITKHSKQAARLQSIVAKFVYKSTEKVMGYRKFSESNREIDILESAPNVFHQMAMTTRATVYTVVLKHLSELKMCTEHNIEFMKWSQAMMKTLNIKIESTCKFTPARVLADLLFLMVSHKLGPWFLEFDDDLPDTNMLSQLFKSWLNTVFNKKDETIKSSKQNTLSQTIETPDFFLELFSKLSKLYSEQKILSMKRIAPIKF